MKFKVGDKVKVIAEKRGHEFDIGEIIKIEEVSGRGSYQCSSLEKNELWWIGEDEFVKFTKADLKDGDIATNRAGEKQTVSKGFLVDNFGAISLTYFTEDLKDADGLQKNDIVKVERPVKYETVFERKEEILDEVEKRYLVSVIKPFRHNVEYIEKFVYSSGIKQIKINVGGTIVNLPEFKNDMYKGMTPDRKYSLKELGL